MAAAAPSLSNDVLNTECSICSDLFTVPKLLPCSHTLCSHCLVSWLTSKQQAHCPICRHAFAEPSEVDKEGWESAVVNALPTDLAMEALVESTRTLSVGHPCTGCVNNAAVSVCLNCGDLYCQACTDVHKRMSLTREHKVETLSTMTPERLAANQPAFCSVHKNKPAELYCSTHNAIICQLCASANHRACQEVAFFENRVEELRAEVADMSEKLRSAEMDHDKAIEQLDQELTEVEKQGQETLNNIETDFDRLENAMKTCKDRLKQRALDDTGKAKSNVQAAKDSLVAQKGELTAHRVSVERVKRAMPAKFLNDVNPALKTKIKDLNLTAKLPQDVTSVSRVPLTVNSDAVRRIEKELSDLDFGNMPDSSAVFTSAQYNNDDQGSIYGAEVDRVPVCGIKSMPSDDLECVYYGHGVFVTERHFEEEDHGDFQDSLLTDEEKKANGLLRLRLNICRSNLSIRLPDI